MSETPPNPLPTIDLCGHRVSRLICGGNPLSAISHFSREMDDDMLHYYIMPNLQALLEMCWKNGINTVQSRGDRHQMRMIMEHRERGGRMNWIAQTASEFADIPANVAEIARFKPIVIYNHGTHTDSNWHAGKMDAVLDVINVIHDHGLPAGVGTHIPEVVTWIEEKGWPVDFYMCCFHNLARGYKSAPVTARRAKEDIYLPEDPPKMTAVMRATGKPCLGFKFLAASRNCTTEAATREAFKYAYGNIKPQDALVAGMFQKYRNQVAENSKLARELAQPSHGDSA